MHQGSDNAKKLITAACNEYLKVLEMKYSGLKGKITEGISALSILKELE